MHQKPETNPKPYSWDELFKRWESAQMTTEQLGGQLLIRSRQLDELLVLCQRELESVSHSVADLEARVQSLEAGFRDQSVSL
ncbi:hypothetical protein KFU94_68465 [Chloroflexi bacterium TSY]|nr:hypothetical protein [Chloroflexi bacterium TSY]